jgi:hypothetical protein
VASDNHVRDAIEQVPAQLREPLDGTLRPPSAGDESPSWLTAVGLLIRFAGLVLEVRTARYLTGSPVQSLAYGASIASREVYGGRW